MPTRHIAVAAVILASAASCPAQQKGVLLAGSQRVSFMLEMNDGAGFRWDLNYNGAVSNGTDGAYSGCMSLTVNGSSFSWSGEGIASDDRREVQVGPWQRGQVRVWRRIAVPAKGAYCRWVDIFENTSATSQTVRVRYQTYAGNSFGVVQGSSGKDGLAEGDWGFLTSENPGSGSSRPALVHVFADKGSKVMPKVQANRNGNTIHYDFELAVPAGKMAALCIFEAQARPMSAAQDFLKKFRPAAELALLSPELRKIIVNMRGTFLSVGSLELPRDEKLDLVVLSESGNELLGTIQDQPFVVETPCGKLELPPDRVVGFAVPADADAYVQLALTDGQVVAGKLLSEPLKLRLESGSEMSLPAAKIKTLAYRVSAQRPQEIALARPAIITRSGLRLYFKPSDVSYAFLTEAGPLDLKADDLAAIYLDTPEGGLHRAAFRNGSVLAGLFLQKDLKASLDLGLTLSSPASAVREFLFPCEPGPATDLADVTMKNEDVLYGRIAQETIEIGTKFGAVKVARDDLAELKLCDGAMDRVEVKLHSGTTVTGRFTGEKLRFRIDPGPEVALFIGHVVKLTNPRPASLSATQPATAPAPADNTEAAADPGNRSAAALREVIAKLRAEQQELMAQAVKLAAERVDLMVLGKRQQADELAAMQAEMEKKIAVIEDQARKTEAQLADLNRTPR